MKKNYSIQSMSTRWAWTLMSPSLVLLLLFIVVPFLMAFYLSFTDERLIPRPIPSKMVGFRNYIRLFNDSDFWQAFYNVVIFALVVVPLQSALALGLAVLINTKIKGRNIFRSIYFLPTIISVVVVCVIWAGLLQIDGLINNILGAITFGLFEKVDWLNDTSFAMPSIIGLSMWASFGFQMVIYHAGLQSISQDLYDAAGLDGANMWQQFWYITMPSLRNTHIFVLLTTTILAFKLFSQVEILTQGGPLGTTNTLVRYIYESGFKELKVGYASAASVLFFLMVLGISLIQRVVSKEK